MKSYKIIAKSTENTTIEAEYTFSVTVNCTVNFDLHLGSIDKVWDQDSGIIGATKMREITNESFETYFFKPTGDCPNTAYSIEKSNDNSTWTACTSNTC